MGAEGREQGGQLRDRAVGAVWDEDARGWRLREYHAAVKVRGVQRLHGYAGVEAVLEERVVDGRWAAEAGGLV